MTEHDREAEERQAFYDRWSMPIGDGHTYATVEEAEAAYEKEEARLQKLMADVAAAGEDAEVDCLLKEFNDWRDAQ